jgi:alanine dehydrogenase
MKSGFKNLLKEHALYPQEALAQVKKNNHSLFIGLPKEMDPTESRVSLTPESVAILVNNGNEVIIETGAGAGAKYSDREYSEAGAKIVYSAKEVYEADIILKIDPPTHEELSYMKPGKTLMSALQMAKLTGEYLDAIAKHKVNALAYEFIEDKAGSRPVVRAMSEICGSTVMLIAGEYLNSVNNGRGVILGGITGVPPTKVVIIGAGTVAEYATRSALGLGAEVKVFDNHIYKLRRLKQSVNQQVYTSVIDTNILSEALKEADVVIGALRSEDGRCECVVSEEMVASMKPNSVIIDVSIDQGGNFATSQISTHKNPVYTKYDVIHYCVPNMASRVARTATMAFSNIVTPMLLQMSKYGGVEEMLYAKQWLMNGVYAYKGTLTNLALARKYNKGYKDISLLFAARY